MPKIVAIELCMLKLYQVVKVGRFLRHSVDGGDDIMEDMKSLLRGCTYPNLWRNDQQEIARCATSVEILSDAAQLCEKACVND